MATEPKVRVTVVDDELIVTLPGSYYSVTYYKPEGSPQLLAKNIADRDDLRLPRQRRSFSLRRGGSPTTRRGNWAGSFRAGDCRGASARRSAPLSS
jgi:hypothetical protein